MRLGLRNLNGEPRGTFRARSESGSADDMLHALRDALSGLLAQASVAREAVAYAVMGSPGVVDPVSGRLQHASNLPGWDDKATLTALQDLFGPNFLIMKDVYLAALGEAEARNADGAKDFVLLSVGRGVGAAVVRDGQPLSGANGLAGEIAFLPLGVDPFSPNAPSLRGSLEEAASADAMLSYGEFDGVAELVRAAREGHPRATEALARESRLVAYALSPLILVADPPLVVLTGSVGLHGGPEFAQSVQHDLAEPAPGPDSSGGNQCSRGTRDASWSRDQGHRTGLGHDDDGPLIGLPQTSWQWP
ncbi:ROK family protein [Pseudarthrobacter sp. Fe7]|nr:ROK family protein [Pseudarthrobacter sp. Fe7]